MSKEPFYEISAPQSICEAMVRELKQDISSDERLQNNIQPESVTPYQSEIQEVEAPLVMITATGVNILADAEESHLRGGISRHNEVASISITIVGQEYDSPKVSIDRLWRLANFIKYRFHNKTLTYTELGNRETYLVAQQINVADIETSLPTLEILFSAYM